MYQLAANIELLFTEAGPAHADRVRAAAAQGFDAVEMWFSTDADMPATAQALRDTGTTLTSLIAGPRMNLTWPGTDLEPFLAGLELAVADAEQLGCERVVVASGVGFPGIPRSRQLDMLADLYRTGLDRTAGSGLTLMLEPVNTRINHPGTLVDRTADAVTIARAVGSPRFGVMYDLYHSIVEGEDPQAELAGAAGLVKYVQLADVPGRGEPGTGDVDWAAQLGALKASGYNGPIGLEYVPTVETVASLHRVRELVAAL